MKKLKSSLIMAGILLYSFVPGFLSAMTQSEYQHQFDVGKNYFESGQFETAYLVFNRLFEKNPEDLAVNFMLGRSAFELRDFETAVMVFDRMLIQNPNSNRARLELARSFMGLGSYVTAKAIFETVLESDPPENVKRNIQIYIDAADAALTKHYFSGMVKVFSGTDDNPQVLPDSTFVDIPSLPGITVSLDSKDRDTFLGNFLKISHRYKPESEKFLWDSSVMNYNLFYCSQTSESIQYYSASTGPVFNKKNYSIQPFLSLSHMDKGYDQYMESVSANLNFNHFISKNFMYSLQGRVEKRDFEDNSRDSWDYSLKFQPVYIHKNITWYAAFVYEIEDAEIGEYDLSRFEIMPGIRMDFLKGLSLTINGKYSHSEYEDEYNLFARHRNEDLLGVSFGVSKVVWQASNNKSRLYLGFDYSYVDVNSTIEIYEYVQNKAMLSCTLEFY